MSGDYDAGISSDDQFKSRSRFGTRASDSAAADRARIAIGQSNHQGWGRSTGDLPADGLEYLDNCRRRAAVMAGKPIINTADRVEQKSDFNHQADVYDPRNFVSASSNLKNIRDRARLANDAIAWADSVEETGKPAEKRVSRKHIRTEVLPLLRDLVNRIGKEKNFVAAEDQEKIYTGIIEAHLIIDDGKALDELNEILAKFQLLIRGESNEIRLVKLDNYFILAHVIARELSGDAAKKDELIKLVDPEIKYFSGRQFSDKKGVGVNWHEYLPVLKRILRLNLTLVRQVENDKLLKKLLDWNKITMLASGLYFNIANELDKFKAEHLATLQTKDYSATIDQIEERVVELRSNR